MKRILTYLLTTLAICYSDNLHSQDKYEYACAINGLLLRDKPNQSGNIITKIPFGSKIIIKDIDNNIISINNELGSWKYISWGINEGWVFGGYLRNYDINEIKKVSSDYFRNYFKNKYSSESEDWKNYHKYVWTQTEKDIKIVDYIGNIYIIQYYAPDKLTQGIEKDKSIWIYHNKSWKLIISSAHTCYLLYLNSDNYPDIITMSGCCVTNDTNVFLGQSDGNLLKVQFLDLQGEVKFTNKGRCSDIKIKHFNTLAKNDSDYDEYYFNCMKNKFIMIERSKTK